MTVVEAPAVAPVAGRKYLMGGAYDISAATNVDEALRLSGLDWEPILSPVYAELDGERIPTTHHAVIRSDSKRALGVVGNKFVPAGNRELAEFGKALVDEVNIPWGAGGDLKGGEMVFLDFALPEGITIAGSDIVTPHIMLTNGHTGNAALRATIRTHRLACGNEVRTGRLQGANFAIRHSGNIEAKIVEARNVLGITTRYMNEFEAIANSLADIDVDLAFFEDFVDELLPINPEAGVRASTAIARQRGAMRLNFNNTETLDPDLKATGWGALNVVTEVIDHGDLAIRKSSQDKEERKFISSLTGSGSKIRERAFDLLLSEIEEPGGIRTRARERKVLLAR